MSSLNHIKVLNADSLVFSGHQQDGEISLINSGGGDIKTESSIKSTKPFIADGTNVLKSNEGHTVLSQSGTADAYRLNIHKAVDFNGVQVDNLNNFTINANQVNSSNVGYSSVDAELDALHSKADANTLRTQNLVGSGGK